MLDQNTDRMWYVIGAILIGAAILFGMNSFMPSAFASVADAFTTTTTHIKTNLTLAELQRGENLVYPDIVEAENPGVTIDAYDIETDTWTVTINESTPGQWWSKGLNIKAGLLEVPWGSKLTLSYEIFVPDSVEVDLHANMDINNYVVGDEDNPWGGKDNDARDMRQYNGVLVPYDSEYTADSKARVPLETGGWTTVFVTYANMSEDNIEQKTLYDGSNIGLVNTTGEPLTVNIRNIRAVVEEVVVDE